MFSLKNRVVRVTSYRGQPRDRLARVLDVRNIYSKPIQPKNLKHHKIERSAFLLTLHDLNKNEFRSYYHSYMTYQEVGFFAKLWYRVCNWWEEN